MTTSNKDTELIEYTEVSLFEQQQLVLDLKLRWYRFDKQYTHM